MLFIAASVAAIAFTGVQAAPSLQLKVSGSNSVTDVDAFSVVTTLTNTGDEVLKLYNDPRTALSKFPEHTFSIATTDGTSAAFIGAHVKYKFETATSFTTLAVGESIDVSHELASAYNFTTEGEYEVNVANLFHYQSADGTAVPIYANVEETHVAKLSGSLVSKKLQERNANLRKRASFASCSSSRQTLINTALTTTTSYVANAVTYLTALTASSTRYATWFGTYSSSGKSTVLSHYTKIQSSDPRTYTYDCSCTEDYYAYVYPDDFGYIYLCTIFWSAPTAGTDSKAGTIVHESSHFTLNGGTDDHAYGQSACKSLALSSPTNARDNADSHEYFAENTPALS